MDGPAREHLPPGHVDTVGGARIRQRKQLLAGADPGEGLVAVRADLDWRVDEAAAIGLS